MRGWAARQKISGKTVDILIKEGFDSMEALILIDSDDLSQTEIQRGQQKLLLKALLWIQSTVCGEDTGSAAATGTRDPADVTIAWNETHADGTHGRQADGIQRDDVYTLDGGPHAFNGFHSVWPHYNESRSLEPCPLSRCPSSRYPFGRIPIIRCPQSR